MIKFELIGREVPLDQLRPTRRIGGPNALVRVLRVLLVGAVELRPGGQKLLAEERAEIIARLSSCALGDTRRICPHIRDQTDRALVTHFDALVEILGDAHRALRPVRQLLRRFLLQRRCREGRRWILSSLATFYVGDGEGLLSLQVSENSVSLDLIRYLSLLAVDVMELGGELLLVLLEQRFDSSIRPA